MLAIFLSVGAWRASRSHVLTRQVPALETLGAATVLGVDKTGTLPLNQLKLQRLDAADTFYEVPADATQPLPEMFHEVVEYGRQRWALVLQRTLDVERSRLEGRT